MKSEKNILIAFILNISFSLFELFGGLFTNSISIMSDAIHDFGDALSIGLSLFLEKKSHQKPDCKYSYGYTRYSILGAFITTSILTIGSILVIISSIKRLINPVTINHNGMIIFAVFGVIVNFLAVYFTKDGYSMNQKAVNLHMLEDVLGWLVVLIGFLSGGLLLFIGDKLFDHISNTRKRETNSKIKRSLMLIFSITLHNIPEGLAVGVAFGSLAYNLADASLLSACLLALGIGLQNFPEGSAVSIPLRREGFSRKKAFFFGQLSGIVEPIAGVIGAILAIKIRYLLPFLLSFAAGAMIYVVVEELIPESQTNKKKDLMALFTLIGFSVMMILDVTLG